MRLTHSFVGSTLVLLSSAAPAKDSDAAAKCQNGLVPTTEAAWKQYKVEDTIRTVFKKYSDKPLAALNPQTPVDMGAAFQRATKGKQDICRIDGPCDLSSCGELYPSNLGDDETVPLFLATKSYVNFANWINVWYNGITVPAIAAVASKDNLAEEFVSFDIPPEDKVSEIFGIISPVLGLFSGISGPAGIAFGAASSLTGLIGAAYGESEDPIDPTYSVASKIGQYLSDFLTKFRQACEDAYKKSIAEATEEKWLGNDKVPALMGNGAWLQSKFDTTSGAIELLRATNDAFSDMFLWKTINYAYKASNVFIIYVPYGNIRNGAGDRFTFEPGMCKDYCGTVKKCFCETNPKGGMARLYRAVEGSYGMDGGADDPKGVDSEKQLGKWKYSNQDIIEGSLNSWRAGDFEYSLDSIVDLKDFSKNSMVQDVMKNGIKATAPGVWNIPVCKIFDMRSWPGAKDRVGEHKAGACLLDSAGGAHDPKKFFRDNINDVIKKEIGGWQTEFATGFQRFGSGSDDGKCNAPIKTGTKGIKDKTIDKAVLQKCLANLDTSKWLDLGVGQAFDCEGMVSFQSASKNWDSPADCHNACKNCLSQAIEDGATDVWCDVWVSGTSAHCWEGFVTS